MHKYSRSSSHGHSGGQIKITLDLAAPIKLKETTLDQVFAVMVKTITDGFTPSINHAVRMLHIDACEPPRVLSEQVTLETGEYRADIVYEVTQRANIDRDLVGSLMFGASLPDSLQILSRFLGSELQEQLVNEAEKAAPGQSGDGQYL